MANKNNGNLQQTLTDNVQQLADMSLSFAQPLMQQLMGNFSTLSQSFFTEDGRVNLPQFKLNTDGCTPKNSCPPHCIAQISRTAMPQERILVPFTVRNQCSTTHTYQIGMRPLMNQDGQPAPDQPRLNKTSVTLEAGASERVLMALDLGKFQAGGSYTAEIVLREKEYNQNICFSLEVTDDGGPVVSPYDEKKYRRKWHGWQSHYYCEPEQGRTRQ
ncbi:hypothetical protein GCM10027051_29000 [Niabella terrae]